MTLPVVILVLAAAICPGASSAADFEAPVQARAYAISGEWQLTWSDEFDGPDGSNPDSTKWVYDVGGNGWLNHELESYTDRRANVRLQGGNLVLEARREDYTGSDGISRHYTSGRLKTLGRFAQQEGRFEARIKIPKGRGLWPAFWMEGANVSEVGWPACGEIDIMENIGHQPGRLYATLHGPGFGTGSHLQTRLDLTNGEGLGDAFHLYGIEWSGQRVQFFLDGKEYGSIIRDTVPHGRDLPFDQPFFMLLNLAVGGDWEGPPDGATVFPAAMLVDYVRVYARHLRPAR
jgi:beta-glucanase (GH16 family)